MEIWFLIIVSLSLSAFLKVLFNFVSISNTHNLPPAPPTFPIIGNITWLRKTAFELEHLIRSLNQKLGPMVTLHIGSRPSIFIADRSLAYQALIQNGAVFGNRPPALATSRVLSSNQQNISSSFYGPTWRLLRRNLTAEILHPSRVKAFGHARKWVLQTLKNRFELLSKSGDPLRVVDHLQFAMFCLLVFMCFGEKLEEKHIEEIKQVQRRLMVNLSRFNTLNVWPRLSKIVLRKRWAEFLQLRKDQEDVVIPLIRARKKLKEERLSKSTMEACTDEYVLSYVDTLLDLQLPDEKRKLNELEIVSLCNEFLGGGTDTTSTALQWIMANLVKYPQIQEKLFLEMKEIVGDGEAEEVKEDDLQKMPFLKAIILEGLRRHPPAHFVLPHAVTEDAMLGGYVIPKNGTVNFMVADMGWDPKVWEDPMAFKPERFLNSEGEVFDITGSREIKMMPFGAGRRICPGYGLAMLHLEYFVANFVWNFEWKAMDGDDIDLSEKQELTIVMKNPLHAHISRRVAG